ncbi:MAG: hypothetical protein JXC36_08500 [Candidatus Atribacteria bacterium]|nr:hypothetical protein [Candidatus Atribacteria bacterium]
MTNEIFFARVNPQYIKITENYNYQADISANQYIEGYGSPIGKYEIPIPYDGEKYFTLQAIKDIEKQKKNAWEQNQLEARIGYISITNYSATDLDKQLSLFLQNNVIPLDIPVKNETKLSSPEVLTNDNFICNIKQDYTPSWPDSIPLQLTVSIFDEDILSELQMSGELENLSDDQMKRVVDSVAQQVGFKRSLIFSFNLILALPSVIGCANDKEPPILTRMSIEWPVATSHRLVKLIISENSKDSDKPIIYDPERGVIEWGDIPFLAPNKKSEGTDLFTYQAPQMLLFIEQPGELYQQEFLKGEIEVKIPRLFSGLKIDNFLANGQKNNIEIKRETTLYTNMNIALEDCFERKTFSPYQHIQFEGVILNDMRMNDIKTLLEDQGFVADYRQFKLGDQGIERYILRSYTTKELDTLRLWMLVEGTRSKTTRRKQIPGGQTYTTEVDTGYMTIYMRGELRGYSTDLVHSMNEIQKQLKERFRHVSTID